MTDIKNGAAEQLTEKNEVNDLRERLQNLIKDREPVTNGSAQNEAPKPNSFWADTSQDFKGEPPKTEKKIPKAPPTEQKDEQHQEETTDQEEPIRKLTHDEKDGSAITNSELTQLITKMICKPLVSWSFKNKFSDQEKSIIAKNNLVDTKLEDIEDKEMQMLKRKFDRLIKDRDRKMGKIEFEEDNMKSLYRAWYNYAQITGKTGSPIMMVIASTANCIGNTIVDITSSDDGF